MKKIFAELRTSLAAILSLAVILCGLYPLTTWLLAQGFFPARSNGSLIRRGGTIVGSRLIGQSFFAPKYFHPRPSAAGRGYDSLHSGGSNLGPLSKKLIDDVRARITAYRLENGLAPDILLPADAVTASASGLDPHISLRNAALQAPRVARARGLEESTVVRQVQACVDGRDLGLLGEPGVNVLRLNLALDDLERAGSLQSPGPGRPSQPRHKD
jgi:K+-transporting ATPase ATPase C chain